MTDDSPSSARELIGVLNVRKAAGWTSHDVVARLRRLSGQKRVGHAGTLDPMAEGVLPILFGKATRLADYVGGGRKRYVAEVQLGEATATDDAEGEVTERATVPSLSRADVEAALGAFVGEIEQVPPAYSAVKVAGRRAYAVARSGGSVELRPRKVMVYELELLSAGDDRLELDVTCSRGTYVRSLARDVAHRLGTVGHLRRLVRTEVGPFKVEDAVTLEQVAESGVSAFLLAPDAALPGVPRYAADASEAAALRNGRSIPVADLNAELVLVYDPGGRLICAGPADGSSLRPRIGLA